MQATATAIAVAVVEASLLDTACKCELAIEVIVQATETIISQAAASAWAEVCSGAPPAAVPTAAQAAAPLCSNL